MVGAATGRRGPVAAAALLALRFFGGSSLAAAEAQLDGHSIHFPVSIYKVASEWFMDGTIIPIGNALVLNPGVPDRVGMLWSSYPLLTNDFEVVLKLQIRAPETATAVKNEAVAFWYVYEDAGKAMVPISSSLTRNQDMILRNTFGHALKEEGFDLVGYRGKFNGLCVVLGRSPTSGQPILSARINDGSKESTLASILAEPEHVIELDGLKEFTLKMRFEKESVKLTVQGKGTYEIKTPTKPSGFFGITSHGGEKGNWSDNFERSNFVTLQDLTVSNHDSSAKGEDIPSKATPAPSPAKSPEEKEDVFRNASDHKEHRAESDAIKDLTNMVFKLVSETQPMRHELSRAVSGLESRVAAMEQTFEHLKEALDKKTGHHLGAEFDAIKKELTTLSSVASKVSMERDKKLDALGSDFADINKHASSHDAIDYTINKLTKSNQRTLENLNSEHQTMFGVSIAAIAFVIIAGLSLYHKFRCWEKKHIL